MPATAIVDESVFANLLGSLDGDVGFMNEMIEAYLASTPRLFADMRQAITTGDAPGLQRAAHSLKSGSAGFGALAFAAQCKELEDMGKMGVLQGAREKVEALEWTYTRVVAALQICLRNIGASAS